ncbi:MAG: metal-dependent transcriptional regulator [Sphingobacteriia bacterium]|nr:MAG: metal-dependent transcriptional regulator [Sphingobacteriia bacterium]TAG32199.1 MAG: metal-dependent transcriptional regulator [Sphingobacteriia bacterium]TAH09272.1 MAG: metal-dependent transcriptional regulator [Sphingobacteriia bacterium]
MLFTAAEENYIKSIFHLQEDGSLVSTNAVAANLHTSAASVTDMLKKLKSKKLVSYEKYKGFKLNTEGKKTALIIIRKHRLWESFLVNTLQFGWDEVHEIADQLEHIQSKKLVDKLDEFLGYPKFDPHGDPIPDSNGKMHEQIQTSLAELAIHESGEISALGNPSSALLELLQHKQIQIGTNLIVEKIFSFDQSMEIKMNNELLFTISHELAKNLFIKKR